MKKRSNGFPLGGAIALCALALVGTANAQTDILSATVSSNLTSITIKGTGLQPASGKPTVSLGSYSLGVANNFTNVEIVAALPADLKPGTYNLEVTANGTANFDVAIGSDGPAGPAGPQGAPGTSITLPFIGTVASADGAAFTLVNTAGLGMAVLGGVTGGGGTAAIGALGGGGSGVTTGGPALSGTGGTGVNGGDGIDVTGGVGDVGGSGISATG